MIESLENRILLNAFKNGGTLFVQSSVPFDTYILTSDGTNISVTILLDGTDHQAFLIHDPVAPIKRISIQDISPDEANGAAIITVSSAITLPCTIIGGTGDDSISGGEGPTKVVAGPGNDLITTGSGNDTIFGDNEDTPTNTAGIFGSDTIDAGAGNDVVSGGPPAQAVGNVTADDVIQGGFGDDSLFGGWGAGGADSMNGGPGNDTLIGGLGNDIFADDLGSADVISYRDRTSTNTRLLVVFSNSTFGTVNVNTNATPAVTLLEADIMDPTAFEVVWGSAGRDTLDATGSFGFPDVAGRGKVLAGFDGNDLLLGNSAQFTTGTPFSQDTLMGGEGDDCLDGGLGNDVLEGDAGNDLLIGAADTLLGAGEDDDSLFGGEGDDTLRGGPGNDFLDGEAGNDVYGGGDGNDTMSAGLDHYTILTSIDTNSGSDTFSGGAGFDVVDYSLRTLPVKVDFLVGANDGDPTANGGVGERDFVNFGTAEVIGTTVDLSGEDTLGVNGIRGDLIQTTADDKFDHIFMGLGGPDTLVGGKGADSLYGGEGDDFIDGGALLSSDYLDGGPGFDTVNYNYPARTNPMFITVDSPPNELQNDGEADTSLGVTPNEFDEVRGMEVVIGGPLNDTLAAGNASTSLIGNGGDDCLVGGAGNDTLEGGAGADSMFGGAGNDLVSYASRTTGITAILDNLANDGPAGENDFIDASVETVQGGSGDNVMDAAGGTHVFIGGPGADSLVGGSGNDTMSGNGGNDTIVGNGGNDSMSGGAGDDCLVGGDGDDTIIGGTGSDEMFGGAGSDWVSYIDHRTGVFVNFDGVRNDGSKGELDLISSDFENIQGGGGNDSLYGNNAPNQISGGGGNDSIFGYNGNDTLRGDSGSDTLHGGNGNDSLWGGSGPDRIIGGKGQDTVTYSDRTQDLSLTLDNLANDGAAREGDNLDKDLEVIVGGSGRDFIAGNSLPQTLVGNGGNDTLQGGGGTDSLVGGNGLDIADYSDHTLAVVLTLDGVDNDGAPGENDHLVSIEGFIGGSGNDSIVGGAATGYFSGGNGNDTIVTGDGGNSILGGNGNDSLVGGTGNDCIVGGNGNDTLRGGDGNDTLVGNSGLDSIFGDAGNDNIIANDGLKDSIDGGPGTDTAVVDIGLDVLFNIP